MCAWVRMTGEGAIVGGNEAPAAADRLQMLPQLPDRLARYHGDGKRDIDAARARLHRDGQSRVGGFVDWIRHACRLTAEKKNITVAEREVGVGGRGFGRQQHQPSRVGSAPVLEGVPVDMPGQISHFEVVHTGPFQRPVGEREAGRFDDVDTETKASSEAQDCSGVAGDIRLVERDAETIVHFRVLLISGRSATGIARFWKFLDLRMVIFCEIEYTPSIVNPNRWRGNS